MQVRFGVRLGAALAVKNHEELAEHVKRGHAGSDQADCPKKNRAATERLPQDQIFREKTGGGRNARDSERSNDVGPIGPRHVRFEPAHLAHVLFA